MERLKGIVNADIKDSQRVIEKAALQKAGFYM